MDSAKKLCPNSKSTVNESSASSLSASHSEKIFAVKILLRVDTSIAADKHVPTETHIVSGSGHRVTIAREKPSGWKGLYTLLNLSSQADNMSTETPTCCTLELV